MSDSVKVFGAIDLGASSGRVIAALVSDGACELREVARFGNGPKSQTDGSLLWDFDGLFSAITDGLAKLGEIAESIGSEVVSVGVDSWAVDYGLIGANGELLSQPHHYRDERNLLGVESVNAQISPAQQFASNGLQFQPFNTIYQIAAEQLQNPDGLAAAKMLLLIPDLVAYLMTGTAVTERTNASTTGLLDATTREWNFEFIYTLGYPRELFTELVDPGAQLGQLLPKFQTCNALEHTVVTAVGSHDTASAVLSVPKLDSWGAYLSSGTWSLLGLELDQPLLTPEVKAANFTNELGVGNRIRFLKNITGLWLLQESVSIWEKQGRFSGYAELLADAEKIGPQPLIDPNDHEFSAPGDMPARIQSQLARNGQSISGEPAAITRCILDSLANSYATHLAELEKITGRNITALNIVGGGSQNELLNQLAANATNRKVVAGPVEATAMGNIASQMAAHGLIDDSIEAQREFVARSVSTKIYQPRNEK